MTGRAWAVWGLAAAALLNGGGCAGPNGQSLGAKFAAKEEPADCGAREQADPPDVSSASEPTSAPPAGEPPADFLAVSSREPQPERLPSPRELARRSESVIPGG